MKRKLLIGLLFLFSSLSLLSAKNSFNIPIPDSEYQALVDFYKATGEANWTNKWNTKENNLHEVPWYGVTVENGHVTTIDLNGTSNIAGSIPASFGNLKFLKTLSMYGGNYSKDLSTANLNALSELESLEYLDLRYCKLKGVIPASWAKLKKLKTLYLTSNALTGLSPEFGQLESLVTAELSENQIAVLIKEIENLTALRTLNLSNNKITLVAASLPNTVNLNLQSQTVNIENITYKGVDLKIDNLPNIISYNRTKNDFSGRPKFSIYVRGNEIANNLVLSADGSLTISASYLSSLKNGDEVYLYQQYDYETGAIASYSRFYFTNIKVNQPAVSNIEYQALVDFYNAMGGSTWNNKWDTNENNLNEGAWFGLSIENGHVTGLDLSSISNVSGSIPASFGNLKYLKNLSFYAGSYSKNLTTTDLNVLSELQSLENLNMSYCRINSAVPSSWSKLKKLKTINLYNSTITGLPAELGEMESLVTLEAGYNQIKSIPVSVGNLANLVTLNLQDNQIEVLVKELENAGALRNLNLSSNRISSIEAFLNTNVNLNLNSQNIYIPNLLYEGTDLKIQNLPNILSYYRTKNDFSSRRKFNLYLRGSQVAADLVMAQDGSITIPASYLSSLKTGDELYFYQQYDGVSGNSYDSRIYFTNIKINLPKIPDVEYQALVAFYNAMNGTNWNNKWDITVNNLHEGAWYGVSIEDGHVTGLNLNNNNSVTGIIPASIKDLKYLKSLSLYGGGYYKDLSTTDLNVLSELESLESLDLRYTKIKGDLPASWGKLKKLKTVYLNYNALTALPADIGGMESLVTFEIPGNQIKTIPASIGNLTNLVTLNLSDNQIVILTKELENIASLQNLNLGSNRVQTIEALLNNQVSLNLNSQNIYVEDFLYEGTDVKIQTLPNILSYYRTKNDFSARRKFNLYLRGSQVVTDLVMAQDGSITIPASYLSSLKTGDELFLYQQYEGISGNSYDSRLYFTKIKINQPQIPDSEYQALVDFYTVMNGTNWTNKWDVSTNNLHEGAWYGISIENGHVTGLDLNNNSSVTGVIPASIKDLTYLKSLSIYGGGYYKDLSTTDLSVLSELANLEYLDLRYSKIKGDLPASWNKLKKLKTLYLNSNSLTALPEDFGGMESLVTVNLSSNQIKTIPVSTGNLSKLVTLNLSYNQIEVLIKDLEKNTALQTLSITSNKLSTIQALLPSQVNLEFTSQTISVPDFLYEGNDVKVSNLPNVLLYNRASNDFSAQRPFRLFLKGNQVGNNLRVAGDGTITIPADYLSTLKTGDELYLYQDYDGGSTSYDSRIYFTNVKVDQPKIPDAEYQALVDFNNAMNGANWNNKWITAENNLHEGAWYGVSIQNGHITGLNLNNTSNVSGTIPASFANLKYLKNLSLYGGNYTKNLSTTDLNTFSALESLESLDLRYTKLKGVVPSSWNKLQALKTLYLGNNNIEDADEALVHLPLLKTVDFAYQSITIPTIEVGANELVINLPVLSTFLFNSNGGVINNKNYFTLYINGVNKASNYSNTEGKLVFKDIALFGIKLSDKIRIDQNDGTAQGTTINYTQVVFGKPLADEEFEILKKIYASTNGAQWTQKWDISQNKLHEVSWYGVGTKDGHVVSLSLSANNLSGTLPAEISDLAYLETLNLQSNAIEGSLPSDLGRLTKLKTLNLQSNKFNGTLPVLSGISGLKKLSIAGNGFKGTIPGHFNDFENIEQIDLSNNGFDALEKPFTYDLAKVYINLRGQVIAKDEYLYLKGDEIIVDLPAITTYNENTQDYSGQYQFELQANNFKISEATAVGNTITFPNISIAGIPAGAKIAIWQKNGTSQGTYLQFKAIADGSETPLIAEEYDALVAFFQSAGGTGWKEVWDTSANNLHEKKWKGVTTNDGHVVSINLPDNNLTGNISAEIGKFSELQNLNLAKNKLTGTIPESVSKVTKLKTVDLSENSLTSIDAAFLPAVNFKIDRQKINLGELPLTLNAVLKDQKINHYDHTNSIFNATQSYNMTLKDYFQMVTVPEDGIKLTNILSEWNVPNNQTLELRQIAGSARNSVLTYTITYREGDSNLDGIVNILDIQSTLNYTLSQKPKFFNYGAADINKDNNLNVLDIIALINKIQAGTLENPASAKRQLSGNEDVILSIEDNTLYIDNQSVSTAAFDIRLKDGNKAETKELLSTLGYTVSVAEREGEISIVGFSMDKSLSGKQAIAKVSSQTSIVSAMISSPEANALSYKITGKTLGVDDLETVAANVFLNYPNPFTDKTVIQYHIPENADNATLKVFDTAGRMVYTKSVDASAGNHEFTFHRRDLASGIYFYAVEVQNGSKPVVLKGKMLIQ